MLLNFKANAHALKPISRVYKLIAAMTVALVFQAALCLAQPYPSPEGLAVVNGVSITHRDVNQETAIIEADLQLRNLFLTKGQISKLKKQVLETLIDRELLYQQSQQRKIVIRSQWIERALLDLKAKFRSTAAFRTYLKDINLTEEQLRERIEKGLIIRRLLRREVLRQIKVSEAEMQAFFRRYPEFFIRKDQARFRQIFVAFPKDHNVSKQAAALHRIQSIQDRLKDGADFAALALEYSEDPSGARGGDLGYLERTQMIPSFAEAAFALQPGQVSDIVETGLGYHLILMVDRIPTSQMAYRNARTKIERTLRRNKEKAAAESYLARLRAGAKITSPY